MRLCLLVPQQTWRPITLAVASLSAIDELEQEGTIAIDLGVADVRLWDGVSPACDLLELWALDTEELLAIRARLLRTVPNRVFPDPRLSEGGNQALRLDQT